MSRTRFGATLALGMALALLGPAGVVLQELSGAEEGGSSGRVDRRPGLDRGEVRRLIPQPVFAPEGFDSIVIFGTNSVEINREAVIQGDVVVNDASAGPTLLPGFEVAIERDATIDGSVTGDTIELNRDVSITGVVSYNELTDYGATVGGTVTPLTLPVFDEVPVFNEAFPTTDDQVALAGQTLTLPPGRYGVLEIQKTATVVLEGSYDFEAIVSSSAGPNGQCPFPCRSIHFAGGTELRVAGRVDLDRNSYAGPLGEAPGAGGACAVTAGGGAGDVVIFAAGTNGDPADPASLPAAVTIDRDSCIGANFYAPNGTIMVNQGTEATGAFFAKDVEFSARGTLSTAFGNQPPIADPQAVQTDGANTITITLTGSDPEGLDLSFSIETPPTQGTLSNLTEIVPDPVPEIDRETGLPTGNFIQPPVTSATVDYTPNGAGDVEDSFVFTVTDPPGAEGMATVSINPFDDTTPEGPIQVIDARDRTIEGVAGTQQTVTLVTDAPDGTTVVYSIVGALPAGSLFDTGGNAIETTPYLLPTNQVVYVPPASGPDSFDFEAADQAGLLASDTATITVEVSVQAELAEDLSLQTEENTPINITLGANPGGGQGSSSAVLRLPGQVVTPSSAAVGGNVADADNDGAGDNVNNLPGSTPGLVSAGVDVSGGPGSNGVTRIQIEWDIANLQSSGVDPLQIDSARVVLHTNKGSVDSLDTEFFVGSADQDGALTVSDFEAPVTAIGIPAPVMPVPDVPTGTQGTFSFDVTGALGAALCGFESPCGTPFGHFSVQGRVVGEQALVGQGFQRGLEVRSTATSNPIDERPILEVDVSQTLLTWRIESLPTDGTLTFQGEPVSVGDRYFSAPTLRYQPNQSFSETDTFSYSVNEGLVTDLGIVTILVLDDGCAEDGREPGCSPGG